MKRPSRVFSMIFMLTLASLLAGPVPHVALAQEQVLLFDDFNGTSLDPALWFFQNAHHNNNASHTVNEGILTVYGGNVEGSGGYVGSFQQFVADANWLILELRARTTENYQVALRLISPGWHGNVGFGADLSAQDLLIATSCSPGDSCAWVGVPAINPLNWHDYRIELTTTVAKYYVDNQLVATIDDPTKLPGSISMRIDMSKGSSGPNEALYVDYVRVKRVPSVISVPIDIKPGSFPNSINLGSKGKVPVAILSTATFDATKVNPATVTLAGAPVAQNPQGKLMASFEEVNGDGRMDLVVHVNTQALQLSNTDTQAILEGQTFGGVHIRGVDTVQIVP